MKLHPDGTLEGTPEEIMKYQQLKPVVVKPLGFAGTQQAPTIGNPLMPWVTTSAADALERSDKRYPGAENGAYTTNAPSQAQYDPFEYHKLEAKAQCNANTARCIK